MNNVKYVELILDSFSESTFNEKLIKELQINFLSEVKLEMRSKFLGGLFENTINFFYIEGIKNHTDIKVFKPLIILCIDPISVTPYIDSKGIEIFISRAFLIIQKGFQGFRDKILKILLIIFQKKFLDFQIIVKNI